MVCEFGELVIDVGEYIKGDCVEDYIVEVGYYEVGVVYMNVDWYGG